MIVFASMLETTFQLMTKNPGKLLFLIYVKFKNSIFNYSIGGVPCYLKLKALKKLILLIRLIHRKTHFKQELIIGK